MGRGLTGSGVIVVVALLTVLRPDFGGLLGAGGGPAGERATAYVVRVIDGDTIEVRIGGRREDVRLIGVDTPETVKPGTPVQCFGPQASHFTHRLLEGKWVRLLFGVERRDIYGRLLAYVHLKRRFVNALLIERGLARTLTIPPNDRFAPLLHGLELRAARSGRGLWGAC
ncbi:MAG TPA: thermonuclease family protein [Solirubrobacterales bacterium]|nr:thermonuclease family protein [Solirubrobacterales bacterium]